MNNIERKIKQHTIELAQWERAYERYNHRYDENDCDAQFILDRLLHASYKIEALRAEIEYLEDVQDHLDTDFWADGDTVALGFVGDSELPF